jgi:glycerol-3-phosphate dehydrogenase
LFLSATSKTSRNFSAGVAIAKGKRLTGTIEGLSALKGLITRAKKIGVKMPVLNFLARQIP